MMLPDGAGGGFLPDVRGGFSGSYLPDTDVAVTFGRWKMGYIGSNADFAYLAHVDCFNATDFALQQGAAGSTYLNSKAGQGLYLTIAGSGGWAVNSSTHFVPGADNSQDFGADATRVRNVAMGGYQSMTEIADPSAPAANTGRLYVKDNGGGKSQLVIRFNTGAVQVIATEP